jgi:transcriptional regulator with PAS, ATPase and Fis domain
MTLATQAKLLRAIENRKFKRVGGTQDLPLEAAIIAATNRDLRAEVKAGRFREDLYFRLNVVPIEMPPLRKRGSDIDTLALHLLDRASKDLGREVPGITNEALDALRRYPWPGNVRELRNVIDRIVILKQGNDAIALDELPSEIRSASRAAERPGCPFELPETGVDLEAVEKGLIEQALERTKNNQSQSARLLGISRFALRYRMEKYGLLESKSHKESHPA